MINLDFSIDIHCHPTYKPLGKSYKSDPGEQSANILDESSLWYYNPPSVLGKLLNEVTGLTKFSQANFTAAAYGNVWVIAASLGCIEKWFFNNKLGTGVISDILGDFATQVSVPRINAIQGINDYFSDLKQEFDYVSEINNKTILVDSNWYAYKIVSNFTELQQVIDSNITKDNTAHPVITIAILPTIEGMHVLNCGLGTPCDAGVVKTNAALLKQFPFKPWFITFTHHFYNELCGHSYSLMGIIAKECDQSTGVNTGFTDLGLQVLDILLDNTGGKRILIDIKHLSPTGRKEFFEIRNTKYLKSDSEPGIPVIISHGACNGLPNMDTATSKYPELGDTFFREEINFYDNEILEMARSNGIFGLQLDERRIASPDTLANVQHSVFRNKIMHYRSQLLWNQVQYIAELLDDNDLPAWDNIAIGSDYDGIVDPLNSFWTLEQYPDLKSYLERHAYNYIQGNPKWKNNENNIFADEIVQRIFQKNAWGFFSRWF